MTSRADSSITSDIICRQLLESIILHRSFCFLVGVFEVFTGVNDAFERGRPRNERFSEGSYHQSQECVLCGEESITKGISCAENGYIEASVHRLRKFIVRPSTFRPQKPSQHLRAKRNHTDASVDTEGKNSCFRLILQLIIRRTCHADQSRNIQSRRQILPSSFIRIFNQRIIRVCLVFEKLVNKSSSSVLQHFGSFSVLAKYFFSSELSITVEIG